MSRWSLCDSSSGWVQETATVLLLLNEAASQCSLHGKGQAEHSVHADEALHSTTNSILATSLPSMPP